MRARCAVNCSHHSRSFVALAGIGGAMMGYPSLDPIAGIAVAGLIFKVGYGMSLTAVHELTDRHVCATCRCSMRAYLRCRWSTI